MAKRMMTRVWWRGYQAVVDPEATRTRRRARGTTRIPHVTATEETLPRRLHIPRRRLEQLAWQHASEPEREASRGGTRRLLVHRGDQDPELCPIEAITDVELMAKIPTNILASFLPGDGGEGDPCG